MSLSNKQLILLGCSAVLLGYITHKVYKRIRNQSLRIISDINIKRIKKIDKNNLHKLYLMASQKLASIVNTLDTNVKLTFYSLYKQINEGDADEVDGNREVTAPAKYEVWLQQKGKSAEQCQREYVALFAKFDKEYESIVEEVLTKKINIKVDDHSTKAGGILSKSVPRPKAEDSTQYLRSLSASETETLKIYQAIREDKNEELLMELIRGKKLEINQKNKEGMDPLILAVDCEFSLETLEFLVDQGCSVQNHDDHGRTALHYAVDLENHEIVRFLLENGADPTLKDYNGSSALDEAQFDEDILQIIKQVRPCA